MTTSQNKQQTLEQVHLELLSAIIAVSTVKKSIFDKNKYEFLSIDIFNFMKDALSSEEELEKELKELYLLELIVYVDFGISNENVYSLQFSHHFDQFLLEDRDLPELPEYIVMFSS